MKNLLSVSICAMALSSIVGCGGGLTRTPDKYRDDTQAVLDQKAGDLKACYDGALKGAAGAAGTVVVHFTVAKETGTITDAKVDAASTAPDAVKACVTGALNGLKVAPPDSNDGDATFTWQFTPPAAAPTS